MDWLSEAHCAAVMDEIGVDALRCDPVGAAVVTATASSRVSMCRRWIMVKRDLERQSHMLSMVVVNIISIIC